jgi:hypothetical protein
MLRRRRSWPSTIHRLFDVVTLARFAVTSRAQLAARTCSCASSWPFTKRDLSSRGGRIRLLASSSSCFHGCWTGTRS